MKKNYSFFLLTLLVLLSGVFTFTIPAQAALVDIQICDDSLFAGGDGTEGNPYQISTPVELYNVTFCSDSLNQGNYFTLTSNINLNGFENRYSGNDQAGWMPIGAYYENNTYTDGEFYGFFDGNYYVVGGLLIDERAEYDQGLFHDIAEGSIVENLGVEVASVTVLNGGIIAGVLSGTIRTSYVKNSTISSIENSPSGGMVGYMNSTGLIEDSYVYEVDVYGDGFTSLGGISGSMANGSQINRVYATGAVNLTGSVDISSLGGISAGWYGVENGLENSFAVEELTYDADVPYIGGLVSKWGEPSESGNNYWYNPEVGGVDACIGSDPGYNEGGFCTSVTDLDLFKDSANEPLASWDIANTDDEDYDSTNDGYPFLAWEKDGGDAETTWLVFGDVGVQAPTLSEVTPIPSEVYIEDARYYFNLSNPSEVDGEFLAEELISDDPTAEVIINPEEEYLTIGGIEVGYTYSTAFTFAYGSENTEILEVGPFTVIENKKRKSGSRVSSRVNSPSITSATPVSKTPSNTIGTTDSPSVNTSTEVRDLTLTFEGDDVKKLQEILIAKNTGPKALALAGIGATGYFGTYTRDALAEYQAPNGIVPSIGYFGAITRAQMKASGVAGLWW